MTVAGLKLTKHGEARLFGRGLGPAGLDQVLKFGEVLPVAAIGAPPFRLCRLSTKWFILSIWEREKESGIAV